MAKGLDRYFTNDAWMANKATRKVLKIFNHSIFEILAWNSSGQSFKAFFSFPLLHGKDQTENAKWKQILQLKTQSSSPLSLHAFCLPITRHFLELLRRTCLKLSEHSAQGTNSESSQPWPHLGKEAGGRWAAGKAGLRRRESGDKCVGTSAQG